MTQTTERVIRICPECGCDRDVLRACLKSLPIRDFQHGHYVYIESEEHAQARIIIANCASCRAEFPGVLP